MNFPFSKHPWMLGTIFLFLGLTFSANEALAKAKRIPVVIVSLESCCPQTAWPEVERKAEAELHSLGYDVRILQLEEAQALSSPLGEIVVRENAVAGIRIGRLPAQDQGDVELWARHPQKGTSIAKRFFLQDTVGSKALSMIALHISEAVDVCLLELGLSPPRASMLALSEPAWSLAFGAFGVFTPDGLAVRPGFELSLDRRLNSLLSLEWVLNTAPPWGPSLKAQEQSFSLGYVSSSLWLFGTWKLWERLRPSVGIGGGAYYIWSHLAASEEYAAQTRITWKGYIGLNGRVGWDLSKHWRLQVGIRVGALLPQIIFRLSNETAKTISSIIVEGIVSARWSF
jgi:hypothetical protein